MPDTSKLEKLNRELEKSEKKLRKAINDEKALQHQLKQLMMSSAGNSLKPGCARMSATPDCLRRGKKKPLRRKSQPSRLRSTPATRITCPTTW